MTDRILNTDFSITFKCEHCGNLVVVEKKLLGKWGNVECKNCGECVKVRFEITRDEYLTGLSEIRNKPVEDRKVCGFCEFNSGHCERGNKGYPKTCDLWIDEG